jgi:hypothetical protein
MATLTWFKQGKGTNTPWGRADCVEKYAPGINSYSTPGHGGFHLSPTRMEMLPEKIKEYIGKGCFGQQRLNGWFEEDCDWAIVAVSFPEYFTQEQLDDAQRTISRYYDGLGAGLIPSK